MMWNSILLRPAAALFVLLLASGCGQLLLTNDQIAAVNTFSSAARAYTQLPDAVISGYAQAYTADSWALQVQTQQMEYDGQGLHPATRPGREPKADDGAIQFDALKHVVEFSRQLNQLAKQTDASLALIQKYAQLLQSLTSTTADGKLDASSTALATALDGGIKNLNKDFGTSVPSLGSTVAEVVRAAGGLVLSGMKEADLQRDVPKANQAIGKLTATVDEMMDSMTAEGGPIDVLEKKLENSFAAQAEAYRVHGSLPMSYQVLEVYQRQWAQLQDFRAQAQAARKAADAVRKAHNTLMESLTSRKDALAQAIEEAQTVVDQVQAGVKLKKSIDSAASKPSTSPSTQSGS